VTGGARGGRVGAAVLATDCRLLIHSSLDPVVHSLLAGTALQVTVAATRAAGTAILGVESPLSLQLETLLSHHSAMKAAKTGRSQEFGLLLTHLSHLARWPHIDLVDESDLFMLFPQCRHVTCCRLSAMVKWFQTSDMAVAEI